MKPGSFGTNRKFSILLCFALSAVFLFGGLFAGQSFGGTAKEIDASADAAMDRFYKQVKGAKEVVRQAKECWFCPML
ncbi:MAG: hypothetical protein JRC59_00865, partial [Deltaproteobacteria bacterium]|nr:hypothetical protein [Deltaproteobacteria bacterium]